MTPSLHRQTLFNRLRKDPFPGRMTENQVVGIEKFLDFWATTPFDDFRWLAYCLGTQPIETGWTMQPVEEGGKGAGKEYGKPDPVTGHRYYGRGLVQLTWRDNYHRASVRLAALGLANVDLVNEPSLANRHDVAAAIMVYGMAEGWFTGKKLPDYFNQDREDWENARQIVNRMDRASEIANHARAFHAALEAAAQAAPAEIETAELQPQSPPAPGDELASLVQKIKELTGAKSVTIEL